MRSLKIIIAVVMTSLVIMAPLDAAPDRDVKRLPYKGAQALQFQVG